MEKNKFSLSNNIKTISSNIIKDIELKLLQNYSINEIVKNADKVNDILMSVKNVKQETIRVLMESEDFSELAWFVYFVKYNFIKWSKLEHKQFISINVKWLRLLLAYYDILKMEDFDQQIFWNKHSKKINIDLKKVISICDKLNIKNISDFSELCNTNSFARIIFRMPIERFEFFLNYFKIDTIENFKKLRSKKIFYDIESYGDIDKIRILLVNFKIHEVEDLDGINFSKYF